MKNGKAPKEKTGETLNETILEADIAPINQEEERRMEAHDTLAIMLNSMGGDETGTAKLDKAYNDLASLLTDWPEGSSHISRDVTGNEPACRRSGGKHDSQRSKRENRKRAGIYQRL